jgi:hypothetical protein
MCLNTKNRVVAVHRCHVGSLNSSIVTPREVFKSAILNNCVSIIVSHQHPSQNCAPSDEDLAVTRRLVESGKILGIEVLDHLIVNVESLETAPSVIPGMIKRALKAGVPANYVLMGTWFTQQPLIQSIAEIGVDVIGMVKNTKQRYLVNGRRLS